MSDQILRKATQLRLVLALPEYQETIGKWIQNAIDSAQHDLETADAATFQKAQGAMVALKSITDQVNSTLVGADRAQKKLEEKNLKEQLK